MLTGLVFCTIDLLDDTYLDLRNYVSQELTGSWSGPSGTQFRASEVRTSTTVGSRPSRQRAEGLTCSLSSRCTQLGLHASKSPNQHTMRHTVDEKSMLLFCDPQACLH